MEHAASDVHSHEEIQSDSSALVSAWLSLSLSVGIAGNFLLVVVILRKGRLRSVSNVFNLNLVAADFIRAVVFTPVYLQFARTKSWPQGILGCKLVYTVLYSTFGVTVFTLVCLSWDRYRATVHPLKKQVSKRGPRGKDVFSGRSFRLFWAVFWNGRAIWDKGQTNQALPGRYILGRRPWGEGEGSVNLDHSVPVIKSQLLPRFKLFFLCPVLHRSVSMEWIILGSYCSVFFFSPFFSLFVTW